MTRLAVLAVAAALGAAAAPAWGGYSANGSIAGSTVRLTLTISGSPSGPARCASRQTLRGTVAKTGRSMSLVLANARQVPPAMPYAGRAKKPSG